VKVLLSDHRTEFMGSSREYVEREGVERQFSSPYVPEQNGRAERLNRTLLEKCRAILFEHSLPKDT
jgi:transposase InsO family protein